MIGEIIKDVYSGQSDNSIADLLKEPIICGHLFRSFNNFTQYLIFLMYSNNRIMVKSQIIENMKYSSYMEDGRELFNRSIANLLSIKIVSSLGSQKIQLNDSFAKNLQTFILNRMPPRGQPLDNNDDSFFNLLLLLNKKSRILDQCKIGNMNNQPSLSKQNFDFIRLPIGYKISSLIKGYLKYKKATTDVATRKKVLKNILMLSELECNRKYRFPEDPTMIKEFEKLHLIHISNNYFNISPYFHNFAFEQQKNTKLLECSIVLQTNFKVYVQMPKHQKKHNYELMRSILNKLIKIDHEDYQLSELIVGEIKEHLMTPLFLSNISVQDYLSFFLEFMSEDLTVEKQLGKWNKINFLGLEGPQHEMMIPNNVKQELKLWKTLTHSSNPHFYHGNDDRFNQDYYNQSDS